MHRYSSDVTNTLCSKYSTITVPQSQSKCASKTNVLQLYFVLRNEVLRAVVLFAFILPTVNPHHLDEPAIHFVNTRDSERPLRISNYCPEVLYPAILTVSGTGPASSGFRLEPGATQAQTVSADWRGRVWGRTNCTFNSDGSVPVSGQGGRACGTGDCGYFVKCLGAVGSLFQNIILLTFRAIHPQHWQSSLWHRPPTKPSMICRL